LLLMVVSLVVMLTLSPLLAVVSVLMVPALALLAFRMRRAVYPASWDAQQRAGEVAQVVDQAVGGVRVVKAFGQEQRELDRLAEGAQGLYGANIRVARLTAHYQPLLQAIPALGMVATLVLGGW